MTFYMNKIEGSLTLTPEYWIDENHVSSYFFGAVVVLTIGIGCNMVCKNV